MLLDKSYLISFLGDLSHQLLFKANFANDNSLYNGKIAAAIFMYDYCELVDEEVYYNLANELTLDIVENLRESDISYTSGLTGIAAGLTLLLENKVLEANENVNLFENLYSRISKQLLGVDNSVSSIGATIFLISQLAKSNNHILSDLERLLHLERIVAHVDLINLNSKKAFFLGDNTLAEQMSASWSFNLIFQFINNAYYSINLLKITSEQKIYPEISNRTLHDLRKIVQKYFDYYLSSDFDTISGLDVVRNIHLIAKLYSICNVDDFDSFKRHHVDKAISQLVRKKSFKVDGYDMMIHIETLNILNKINHSKHTSSLSNSLTFYLTSVIKFCTVGKFAVDLNSSKQLNVGISGLAGIGLTCLSFIDSSTLNWEKLIFCSE